MCTRLQDAAQVPQMRDRAKIALKNADIRKRKGQLNSRMQELEPLIKKGKISQQLVKLRRQQVWLHCSCLLVVCGVCCCRHNSSFGGSRATGRQVAKSIAVGGWPCMLC
jgi:hypothetical protein